ncbi:MAG: hypothetical protein WBG48_03300 [Pricia sp.]
MKIRIKDNAIRLRLTKSEVAELCEKGCYKSQTEFNDAAFTYGLRIKEHGELSAAFEGNSIMLDIPSKLISGWDTNAQIGFENNQALQKGKTLHLLVEKDFTCLDDRMEDESDNYPNPKMAQ